jgi:hypothetical protein
MFARRAADCVADHSLSFSVGPSSFGTLMSSALRRGVGHAN